MKTDLSRRRIIQGAAVATGALAVPQIFRGSWAAAASLPDPDKVLAGITPGNYVKKEYLKQFNIGPKDLLWDPNKDWISTVDWEKVRSQFMGTTVRMAVGAADADSVRSKLDTFQKLSGIDVEVVPIPDASLFDKAMTDFSSGAGRFDCIEYFSPYLGDFAAPGYLHPIGDFADKWQFPIDDFADTYRLNYSYFGDQMYGIPYDCDFQMIQGRNKLIRQITGSDLKQKGQIRTYDDLLDFAKQVNQPDQGHSGIALMTQRGFWATYTWQHVGAQFGLDMFDSDWEPLHDSEASRKACEVILELQKSAPTGVTGWGWPENRQAWLGGQTVMNIAWQDQGNQATRPDQSNIWKDDIVSIYEPMGTGPDARFAPPNIAGSTSSVSKFAKRPEAAFLLLAFLNTASFQAIDGANADGVGTGYKSVLANENYRKIMTSADVWAAEVDYAWCAPRIPGALAMDITFGNELNAVFTGNKSIEDALADGKKRVRQIMKKNGFYSAKPPVDYASVADGLWLGKGKQPPY
ncbi:MAG TPA: extracellular solute-binding protein [Gammaproteobacteria bacterium]|nr:extracellular solute-binding protein [Gammaproteobacteria bacterium]